MGHPAGRTVVVSSVAVPPALRDRVREHAEQQGVSMSEVYRQAVTAYLARQRKRERANV